KASDLGSRARIGRLGAGARCHDGGHARWGDMERQPRHAEGWPSRLPGGRPTKAEVVVLRVKLPANYQVPPHTHPYSETITVISGSLGNGMGEKFEKKGEMLKPGSFFALPAKHAHFVWTGNEEVIIQVQFVGPGVIDYINPADDPRKKTQ